MANPTTSTGIATSFTNTPQAKDDSYEYSEDNFAAGGIYANGVVTLDVTNNDLGGAAKTLYSVSDGDGNPLTVDFSLLSKDTQTGGISAWEKTFEGQWMRINNGKIDYAIALPTDIDCPSFVPITIDALAGGQVFTDSFVVSIRLGNGTLSQATVAIRIVGTNDAPTLTIADATGTMSEDNGTATLTDTGALSFADIDMGDVVTISKSYNNDFAFSGGSLSPALQAALVEGFSVDNNSWDYSSSENLDFLAVGETISFSFNVVATDDSGAANAASTPQKVTITINGTNDAPVISGIASGAAQEDTTLTATGTLLSTDVDAGATATWSIQGSNSGIYGSLALDGNGKWTYSLNNGTNGTVGATQSLAEGESRTETFMVRVTDEHSTFADQAVTITVTGTNDQPTLTIADTAGVMNEGNGTATLHDSGALSFADIDGDVVTVSESYNDDIEWSGGSLSPALQASLVDGFKVDQNSWDYSASENLDFLAVGQTISFSFNVVATDDSGAANAASAPQKVTITINGTNDAPVISGIASGAAQEDTTLTATGTLLSTDVDAGATATWSIQGSNSGIYGSLALDGNGKWTYSLNNGTNGTAGATQSLAEGESRTETFMVRVTDEHSTFADQAVTITVTGTNDQPTLTIADTAGVMNEGNGTATLHDSGTLIPADIDNGDAIAIDVSHSYNNDFIFSGGSLSQALIDALVDGFSVDNNSWDYNASANLDFLAVGQTISFSFDVVATDDSGAANAASAVQKVTITINGTNDAPVIIGTASGAAKEDTTLTATGTLTSTDVDNGATATWSIFGSSSGTYGSLALDGNTGKWTYTLANGTNGTPGATQSLAEGESHDETFTVRVTDEHGGVDNQTVTITVTGTNDQPTLTIADTAGTMNEGNGAANLTDNGVLSFGDIDNGDVVTASKSYNNDFVFSGGSLSQALVDALVGGFSVDNNSWDYSASENLDFLAAGQTISFSFDVVATDDSGAANAASTKQKVTVTINGTNDAAELSAAVVSLDETNAPLTTGGTLTNSDVDNDDTFVAQASTAGANGIFSISAAGVWTYTANSAFDSLNVGSSVSDTFSVAAIDGTLTSVKVTINGTNDIPVISGETSGDRVVKEESDLSAGGTLSIIDADAGQSEFTAGAGSTTYGNYTLGSNGVWSYTLNNANGTVQALGEGVQITDNFLAVSEDGTASKTVTITITGTAEGDPNDFDGEATSVSVVTMTPPGPSGVDTIRGSAFNDTLYGGGAGDLLYGGAGDDYLDGEGGADILYGGSGNDKLVGGAGVDALYGGSGDDIIDAGGSADVVILGGLGNDTIIASDAADTMTGGDGADIFKFVSLAGNFGADSITDFNATGVDKISLLSSIFTAITGGATTGLDSNEFVANATGSAMDSNDYIVFNTTTGVLSYDTNGNGSGGSTQFVTITLTGTLDYTDFIFGS